jgi:hypothetical protein
MTLQFVVENTPNLRHRAILETSDDEGVVLGKKYFEVAVFHTKDLR